MKLHAPGNKTSFPAGGVTYDHTACGLVADAPNSKVTFAARGKTPTCKPCAAAVKQRKKR